MNRKDFEHTGEESVNRWYQQIEHYDFENHTNKNGKRVGSFTQAVWKTSQILGVGIALEKDGEYIVGRVSNSIQHIITFYKCK